MAGHVYEWARRRGYWVTDPPFTHLLLDGGKLRVPPESEAAFLNAYAASLFRRPDKRPCIVELRTPVFKMFVDLDMRWDSETRARDVMLTGVPTVVSALGEVVSSADSEAIVCLANAVKEDKDGWKMGMHVVWPGVLVTSGTAVALRTRMLERLAGVAVEGLRGSWDTVVDSSVYTSNGLRMPWSAKGRGDGRYYRVLGTDPDTVSSLRDTLRRLSIRTHQTEPTIRLETGSADIHATSTQWVSKSLAPYADVLDGLAGALPVQFLGQKFTGMVATEHCYMFRSTARYCFNLGTAHRTNNVYFMLTKKGVCQRCFCRCETTEGRKYGMCKDFSSDYWTVPPEVIRAFFPEDDEPEPEPERPSTVASMPSRMGKSYLSLDNLVARSRPKPPAAKKKRT